MLEDVLTERAFAPHPQLFQHASRSDVLGMVIRDDAVQSKGAESEVEQKRSGLGRDALTPVVATQAVSDVTPAMLGRDNSYSGHTDELARPAPNDPKAVLPPGSLVSLRFDAAEERLLLCDGSDDLEGHEPEVLRVGSPKKRLGRIRGTDFAQPKAVASQRDRIDVRKLHGATLGRPLGTSTDPRYCPDG